jgi:hypothetical protein
VGTAVAALGARVVSLKRDCGHQTPACPSFYLALSSDCGIFDLGFAEVPSRCTELFSTLCLSPPPPLTHSQGIQRTWACMLLQSQKMRFRLYSILSYMLGRRRHPHEIEIIRSSARSESFSSSCESWQSSTTGQHWVRLVDEAEILPDEFGRFVAQSGNVVLFSSSTDRSRQVVFDFVQPFGLLC